MTSLELNLITALNPAPQGLAALTGKELLQTLRIIEETEAQLVKAETQLFDLASALQGSGAKAVLQMVRRHANANANAIRMAIEQRLDRGVVTAPQFPPRWSDLETLEQLDARELAGRIVSLVVELEQREADLVDLDGRLGRVLESNVEGGRALADLDAKLERLTTRRLDRDYAKHPHTRLVVEIEHRDALLDLREAELAALRSKLELAGERLG